MPASLGQTIARTSQGPPESKYCGLSTAAYSQTPVSGLSCMA